MRLSHESVAVVTGAASGIGRALAVELAGRGIGVVAADRDEDGLSRLAESLPDARLDCENLDVADREAFEDLAARVRERHGRVDLVINNAGVALSQTVEAMDYADFEWLMQINFWGMVYGAKAFLPALIERGCGSLVFVSSIMGICSAPTQSAYNASKFGIRGFAESLAQEVEDQGVEVLVVCPGGVRTNIIRNARIQTWTDAMPGFGDDPEADFDRLARTPPERAARLIVEAVERGRRRLLIGSDARWMDRVQRLAPVRYASFVRRMAGWLARAGR